MDRLITTAIEKVNSLQSRISHLHLLHFPSGNPALLITLFSRIAEALLTRLEEYRREALEAAKNHNAGRLKGIEREVRLSVLLVKKIASQLRYVEGARVERTPWSFIVPLEKLAQKLLTDTRLIIRPQWHYNYGVVEIIEQVLKQVEFLLPSEVLASVFKDLPKCIYVFSFPSLEQKNVLLHVNFGHEIGHPFAEKYLSQEKQDYLIKIQEKVNSYIKSTEPPELPLFSSTVRADELAKRVADVRKRALEEIICDFISVQLFGPAAVFALDEMATFSESLDTVSRRTLHPPWRMRLRLVLEELNWSEWETCLSDVSSKFSWGKSIELSVKEKIQSLQELVRVTADQKHIESDISLAFAYSSVQEALPEVKTFIRNELKAHLFVIDQDLCMNIFKSVERLYNKVPPNEININSSERMETTGLRAILNAGWLYKLTRLNSMFGTSAEEFFRDLDVLNRLILKAAEMIDLQREYEKYKDEVGKS
jgi:hypothetical protein